MTVKSVNMLLSFTPVEAEKKREREREGRREGERERETRRQALKI